MVPSTASRTIADVVLLVHRQHHIRYYTFDTCGSGYDTWLHIYGYNTDGSTGALISSCDDCGPCGNRIVLTLGLTPGTYWLVMDGWASSQGTYRMAVRCEHDCYARFLENGG